MKKITNLIVINLIVGLVVFGNLLFVSPVFAHILATNGSIGAVLHIDPDDDPVAGQQSSIFFEFKDKQNKFNPVDCLCTFYVYEGEKMIYYNSLTATTPNPTLDNIALFYTFPQKDVYKISVVGYPSSTGNFQSFTLNYDIRVDKGTDQSATSSGSPSLTNADFISSHTLYIIGAVVACLLLIVALIKQKLNNQAKKSTVLKKGGEL